jgi:hypothetical protein
MYRTFTDKQGRKWEVRERSKSEWELHPAGDNRERMRTVRSPGYERDPFELSTEELERLLGEPGVSVRSRQPKSPFND